MPCLGIGSWQVPEGNALLNSLSDAIHAGYRLIDTASIYGNERAVGIAMRNSGVPRSDFFLVDKVWNADRGCEKTLEAFRKITALLGTSYLDLYMIHWPATHEEPITCQAINAGTWRALEKLYRDGSVRAIGVSNFLPHHLVPLLARAEITPMVNSLEFHPGYPQFQALRFSHEHGMKVLGWAPLGRGALMEDPLLQSIAAKHGKTIPQVGLRWALEHGVVPVPKSTSKAHIEENASIFDFTLPLDEMRAIDRLPLTAFTGLDPDTVNY